MSVAAVRLRRVVSGHELGRAVMHGVLFEGIVRRGSFRVHAPLVKRKDGSYVNLNTGLVEDVISSEQMARDRIRCFLTRVEK